jgi:hypothetical protein
VNACPRLFAFARRPVSTFEQRTARRYNNTHCTYGVNLQHEGSISELHCAKSFFSRAREDRTIFSANNNSTVCITVMNRRSKSATRSICQCVRYYF